MLSGIAIVYRYILSIHNLLPTQVLTEPLFQSFVLESVIVITRTFGHNYETVSKYLTLIFSLNIYRTEYKSTSQSLAVCNREESKVMD